ncbi:MAG: hypothetical protein A2026_04695 [Deltaproteobacteria bacterium RBG_19FT_COMBO_46_12]|nr:MAG: hypothetical protein A2026_04695 [Deltaproteobacteria bacterium RBG_19FT_COMBO_46_12]
MAKERCQICGIEKAKRTCKIKDQIQICPVCCSKLRSDKCEDCTYYEPSVRYHSERFEKPMKEKPFIAFLNRKLTRNVIGSYRWWSRAIRHVGKGNEGALSEISKLPYRSLWHGGLLRLAG